MTRRQILGAAGAASAWLAVEPGQAQSPPKTAGKSGAARPRLSHPDACGRGGSKPFDFVEHCHNLGLGVGGNAASPARTRKPSKRSGRRWKATRCGSYWTWAILVRRPYSRRCTMIAPQLLAASPSIEGRDSASSADSPRPV